MAVRSEDETQEQEGAEDDGTNQQMEDQPSNVYITALDDKGEEPNSDSGKFHYLNFITSFLNRQHFQNVLAARD